MTLVEALLEERRGYVMRGLKARVAAVDAELKKFGVAVDGEPTREAAVVEPETERAAQPKARSRKV